MINRRTFLQRAAAGAGVHLIGGGAALAAVPATEKADYTLRIAPLTLELAPGVNVKTTGFNGTVPGPMLRLKDGTPVTIDVFNETANEELTHWHGLHIDSLNDGAMEEGSQMNPAHAGRIRYRFTPSPAGMRWYHTHTSAGMDVDWGTYSGQFGFLYVEPRSHAGAYDQEIFLAVHHWEPTIVASTGLLMGLEVRYKHAAFNGRLASASEPVRVRKGQRVLFHFLNASANNDVVLALPGHQFEVQALDGNPVPTRQKVSVSTLSLSVAERVDAIVEMTNPGVWMLGSTDDAERGIGLGIPVEYAGSQGPAVWKAPEKNDWSYSLFADATAKSYAPDVTLPMLLAVVRAMNGGMDRWTAKGKSYPDTPPIHVQKGKRYRMSLMNGSPESHPMHLHRHSFEVVSIADQPVSGLWKDTTSIDPWKKVDVDFVADNPGKTLFHCHQQLHMDCGMMQLIDYV